MNNSSTPVAEPVPEVDMVPPVVGESDDPLWFSDMASGNGLFSQLDSMMAAVQNESHAMDNMRCKLKELDAMKTQISNLSKRLLEADQVNLTMKGNIITLQESYADLKKKKAESDSAIGPLRIELTRAKDMLGKERSGRLALQQELVSYKDRCDRMEKLNEELQAECRTIPSYVETCELLKNDLSKTRKQFKTERNDLIGKLRLLERENVDTEAIQGEVKILALRLLDIATNQKGGNGRKDGSSSNNGGNGGSLSVPNVSSHSPLIQYRHADQHNGSMRDTHTNSGGNSSRERRQRCMSTNEYDDESASHSDASAFDRREQYDEVPVSHSNKFNKGGSLKQGKGNIMNPATDIHSASVSLPSSNQRDRRKQNDSLIYVSKGLKDLAKKQRVKKQSASVRSMEREDESEECENYSSSHDTTNASQLQQGGSSAEQTQHSHEPDEELEKMNAFMNDHGQQAGSSSRSHRQPLHESRHARKIKEGTSFPRI